MLIEHNQTKAIFLKSYQIVAKIQEGAQAIILLARNKEKLYGIKVYKHGHIGKRCFENQIQILDCIHDKLVVKPIEICSQELNGVHFQMQQVVQPFLVMQYYRNGDLRHYMNSGAIPLRIRNHIIKSLANCLKAIQMCDVLHCDIKPQNFLVDSSYQLHLIDFGMGMHSKNKKQELVGSPNYIAPQIYKSRNYSYKSEIFAFGVICFQLAFNSKHYFPFKVAKNSDANFLLIQQKIYSKFWAKFPSDEVDPAFKQFLQKLLSPIPEQRPSASQILLQPCLKDTASEDQCRVFFQNLKPRPLFQQLHNCNTF